MNICLKKKSIKTQETFGISQQLSAAYKSNKTQGDLCQAQSNFIRGFLIQYRRIWENVLRQIKNS